MVKFNFDEFTSKYLDNQDYGSKFEKIKKDFFENGQMKGWYDINRDFDDIKKCGEFVRTNADIFIVIGIGGSYLGSKAIIDALSPYFGKKKPEILFAGYNLSSDYLSELLDYIKGKRIIVNVISKSGGTIEPNVAFNMIYDYMKTVYNDSELSKRIIVTTDGVKSKLLDFANSINCYKFVIPSDVGGRFSVLTPVGLLPFCVMGIDIDKLFNGFIDSRSNLDNACEYARIRDLFYRSGRVVEAFTVYDEKLYYFTEWLKQLFAETQGKDGKAILPISLVNTRDLHSMGQYMQDGKDFVFETNLFVSEKKNVYVKEYDKSLGEIERLALNSVCKSYYNGHTPSIVIEIDKINEYNLGYLICFFFVSSAFGAYLLDVNYYDQPGVNGYKDILNESLGE